MQGHLVPAAEAAGGSGLQQSVVFWWLIPSQQQGVPMGPVPAVPWWMESQQEGQCEALTRVSAVCTTWAFVCDLELPSSPCPMPGTVPLAHPGQLWVFSQPGFDTQGSPGSAGNAAGLMSTGQLCLHLLTLLTFPSLCQCCDLLKVWHRSSIPPDCCTGGWS